MFIFEREGETEHKWERGSERGRHRITSRLQALSCQHRARRGARTHRPRDHDLSRSQMLNLLSHSGAPRFINLFFKERQHKQGRGREKGGGRHRIQSRLQAPSC